MTDEVWLEWRRRPRISYADADYVRERIRTPATFAKFCEDRVVGPLRGQGGQGHRPGRHRSAPTSASGTTRSPRAAPSPPQEVQTAHAGAGRGHELAEKLLPGVDPVGKTVQIGGLPYRIIGVVAKQGTLFGLSLDKFAVMPFSAPARRLICPINILDALIVRTDDPGSMQRAMGEAEAIMRSRRRPQAVAGEQFRVPDGGGRAGHLGEDLQDPVPGAARAGGHLPGGGRHRHHEHHADGGERADPRDRHPEGARRPPARHPGPVRGRVGHAVGGGRAARASASG